MAKKANVRPTPQAAVKQPQPRTVKKESPARDWFTVKSLCIILGIIAFLLYVNTLQNGFVLDDTMVLEENLIVKQGLKGIPELFATPHMRGFLIIPNDLYRPLSLVMFAIEYQFFPGNPAVHHFFNILTFMGCVIMLFLFLDKFFDRKKTAIAFIAALVFAVHPIHTEVVANIKSRDELMCYFFGLWSLNLFMNYMKEGKMTQLLPGIFTLYLAYISKETVITFVAIIPILFFLYNNENRKRAVFITGGMVVATGIFMVVRTIVLAKYNANLPGATVDFIDNALSGAPNAATKIATEFYILGKYLWLMFVPYPLLANYSFNSIPFVSFGDYKAIIATVSYLFLGGFAVYRLIKVKKDPWAFAIIFYLATLSLFSNFPFLMGAEMAERFAFFASTGICIAAALAIEKWVLKADAGIVTSIKSSKALMILVPLTLIFGGMTVARNADWKNEYLLFKTDLDKSPNDARLYHYVATALAERMYQEETDTTKRAKMDLESIEYLKKSLAIYPDFAEAHVEMGRVLERTKQYPAAVEENKKALALKPFNATANNNMGSVYITMGLYRESIPYLLKSAELNPNFKFVYLNLARSYNKLKVYDSAIMNYNKMLEFDPNYMAARKEVATAYFLLQKYDSAAIHFKIIAEATPDDADAINNLGAVYLNGKKYPQAIEQFKKSMALNPNYLNAYSNLGKAYYLSGQYQAAIDILSKEISINQAGARDLPYIALSYQKMGKMDQARQYEALAKRVYADFKLE